MKKTVLTFMVSTLIFSGAISGFASGCCDASKAPSKPASRKIVTAVCPVMGTKIPDVTKAAGKSVYKGKTYYFCCGGCKPQFDKDPAKYVK